MRAFQKRPAFTREVMNIAGHLFAVVSLIHRGRREQVFFAVPPDASVTGRLWMKLEDVLTERLA